MSDSSQRGRGKTKRIRLRKKGEVHGKHTAKEKICSRNYSSCSGVLFSIGGKVCSRIWRVVWQHDLSAACLCDWRIIEPCSFFCRGNFTLSFSYPKSLVGNNASKKTVSPDFVPGFSSWFSGIFLYHELRNQLLPPSLFSFFESGNSPFFGG